MIKIPFIALSAKEVFPGVFKYGSIPPMKSSQLVIHKLWSSPCCITQNRPRAEPQAYCRGGGCKPTTDSLSHPRVYLQSLAAASFTIGLLCSEITPYLYNTYRPLVLPNSPTERRRRLSSVQGRIGLRMSGFYRPTLHQQAYTTPYYN